MKKTTGRALKRTGLVGIALGALALIACEAPIVLAVLGLGGLGAGTGFAPSPFLEIGGAAIVIAGGGLLLFLKLKRARLRRKDAGP